MSEYMTSEMTNQPQKIGRFERSLELTKSAWRVLKLDKELLAIPLISMLVSVILLGIAIVGLAGVLGGLAWSGTDLNPSNHSVKTAAIVFGFIYLLAATFISSLTSGAIIHGALERFGGNDPTVKSSVSAALKKSKPLFLFSLLAATIGFVLRAIEDRVPLGGKIVAWLTDIAWSVASLFAIPYIMTTSGYLGPIKATKKSATLIKKVWGESLIVSGGIGIIGLISILGYILLATALTFVIANLGGASAGAGIGWRLAVLLPLDILGFLALILILSVLGAIAKAAVFYWATTGEAPETFNKDLMQAALTTKKARKIFA